MLQDQVNAEWLSRPVDSIKKSNNTSTARLGLDNHGAVTYFCTSIQKETFNWLNFRGSLQSEAKYKERGERLRKILEVDGDNTLSSRKFRNNFFEHCDARIEEWFSKQSSAVYIDLAMNPSFPGRNLNSHRGYNSFDNTLEFREEKLDLNEILNAMETIFEKCKPFTLTQNSPALIGVVPHTNVAIQLKINLLIPPTFQSIIN